MITPEYLDELERLCEAANDILDFDYEAQGCAWMPLLKSHRDMLQCGIDQIPELVAEVRRLSEWQPIETAPIGKYVILNISPLNYPVIAAKDDSGWMTRTGAFYGIDTADYWMPLPSAPTSRDKE